MLFAIEGRDKPGASQIRAETRPMHLEYLESLNRKLVLAGPFTDDAGNSTGSLVIVNVADRAEAEHIAEKDPYFAAGLFAQSEIRAWKWSINKPEDL